MSKSSNCENLIRSTSLTSSQLILACVVNDRQGWMYMTKSDTDNFLHSSAITTLFEFT